MSVGIGLGNVIYEIGSPDFLHAFFSTISGNLEPHGWGSRFPIFLRTFYSGELRQSDASQALSELQIISNELCGISFDKVIWDIDDRRKSPPWGDDISGDITDLSNYFVTSTGRDLFMVVRTIFEKLHSDGGVARIVQIPAMNLLR